MACVKRRRNRGNGRQYKPARHGKPLFLVDGGSTRLYRGRRHASRKPWAGVAAENWRNLASDIARENKLVHGGSARRLASE